MLDSSWIERPSLKGADLGTEMPTVIEDLGWRLTDHTGGVRGEIGGHAENSRRQAWYAPPFRKPLTSDGSDLRLRAV